MNRFSQKDLLKGEITSGTSLNRYLYCQNDPMNYADHDGQRLSTSYLTPDNGNRLRNQKPSQNQTPKTPVKPRSSGVSHPAQSNLQKTQRMVEEIHDQNPFVKSSSKKLFKDYTGIDVDETDKAPYKLWDGKARGGIANRKGRGKSGSNNTAKPWVQPVAGTERICAKAIAGTIGGGSLYYGFEMLSWLMPVAVGAFKASTRNGDADSFLSKTIGAERDEEYPNVYHIKQDYWQSTPIVGYNDLYDVGFKVGVGATGGSADRQKFPFTTADGTQYMLWLWKGDYINLGAGAEAGIYKKSALPGHYLTSTENAMKMTMRITDHNTGKVIANYSPDEYQWWITSFNPQHQNVQSRDLDVTFTFDFSNLDEAMWEAFSDQYADSKIVNILKNHRAEITWRR